MKQRRGPEKIKGILSHTLGSYVLREKAKEYSAFPFWEEIVGKDIAAVAIPEKINRGKVLVIRVLDAVWAQELSLRKTEILDGFHRFGKGAIVEDVKFIIGNPQSLQKAKKQ